MRPSAMTPWQAGEIGRRLLPPAAFRLVRRFGNVLWAPLRFSLNRGHARSAWLERAVDRTGRPVPWYTYSAIDFLAAKSFSGCAVLEFGAGQSTLWWGSRGVRLTALEEDPDWHAFVASRLGDRGEVLLVNGLADLPARVLRGRYDVIVIDGLRRQDAARLSIDLLSPRGAIVFDNSEGLWSDDGQSYEVVDTMHAAGFSRVDFYGFAPGAIGESCTSIYFRDSCFLFEAPEPPRLQSR